MGEEIYYAKRKSQKMGFESFPVEFFTKSFSLKPRALYSVQQEIKLLKNESFTLLVAACLSRFGETTSCVVCNDPTGVDYGA